MPSIDCTDEIEINATPQQVFSTVADYNNWHRWIPMFQCQVLDADAIAPGVRVRHRYGPRRLTLSAFVREIRSVTPGERIEEAYVEGDLVGDGIWSFTQLERGTLASYRCVVSSNNFMSHIALALAGERGHKGVYATVLEQLKSHCEQQG